MRAAVALQPSCPGGDRRDDRLDRYLSAYWLRPENAFWMALRSEALRHVPLEAPALDVSCGDGVFLFLHCGGVFGEDFDVFTSAVVDKPSPARRPATDDMFDHVEEGYRPAIVTTPSQRIATGTDWKRALLAKAERLDLYERLVRHDNNLPQPFEDESFRTIYCNAAYWVHQIDRFLSELSRLVRSDGRIILHVKLADMRSWSVENYRSTFGDRFVEIMGRGRLASWPTVADRGTWELRFARAGLEITSATPFVTATHARIWDVGLRPIAPLLVRMTRGLSPETKAAIKRDWVELFQELLEPISRPDFALGASGGAPAEIQYVLRRR